MFYFLSYKYLPYKLISPFSTSLAPITPIKQYFSSNPFAIFFFIVSELQSANTSNPS